MRDKRKRSATGMLAAVLAAGVAVPTALAGSAAAIPVGTPGSGPLRTITLLTGDQVLVGGPQGATVRPAKGRENMRFLTQKDVRGDIHVTPLDATSLVRSGQLDPRLFNVTKLVEHGYGDDARKDIPLIVSSAGARAQTSGAKVVRELPSIGGAAVRADKGTAFWQQARGARAAGAQRIWLDGPVKATLDKSVPQIGAPAAWQAGFTGKNTTVAVLDTGIDSTHPDLADAVAEGKDFTDSASGTADKFGHGTHVASIVTGRNDKYNGVAPDTKLLNGKVLNDGGGGSESWIIAGMEWAAASGAKVINMSLGSPWPSNGKEPMDEALNKITAQSGALFVVSAGNSGGTPGSPAAADSALTVGAVDSADALAEFSSRGPRWEDGAIKPDITGPGVDIVAAKAKGSFLGSVAPNVGDQHLRLSGTSMSSPHVAGAAAILAGQHPDWKADELKSALMGSAKANPALSVFEQGAGRVDVAKAVTQQVRATPASLSNGVAEWPHADDKPIDRTVTYHNSGTTPVTLNLTADVHDPAGKPAPAGMFTVTPSTLTVPAGGKAEATVTTNTTVNGPDGMYSGAVIAGDIRTPIAVDREVESYSVKLTFLGFDGKPTPDYSFRFVSLEKPKAYLPHDDSGTVVARLPKGHFYFESWVQDVASPQHTLAMTVEPDHQVSGPAEFTVDARNSQRIGLTVDKPNAQPGQSLVSFSRDTQWGGKASTGSSFYGRDFDYLLVQPSKTAAPGQFEFAIEGRLAEPDGKGGFSGSDYLYNVRSTQDGQVPATLLRHVKDGDLAKVRSNQAATAPGKFGDRESVITKPLPYSLDEFYTPDVPWYGSFSELTAPDAFPPDSGAFTVMPRSFKLGRTTTEQWNYGVFGPAFPKNEGRPWTYAGRLADDMVFSVALYTGSGSNREGYANATGSTTLYRDGKVIGSEKYVGYRRFTVPSGTGTYQLHTDATRDGALSSKLSADWTFTSGTVGGTIPQTLPLLSVRFAPKLDDYNRASNAVPALVPIMVDHNAGAAAKPTKIEVSHDDGATWQAAPLVSAGGKWFTLLVHPKGAKSVSLKASAKDDAGNTVDQTIIGAFLLK